MDWTQKSKPFKFFERGNNRRDEGGSRYRNSCWEPSRGYAQEDRNTFTRGSRRESSQLRDVREEDYEEGEIQNKVRELKEDKEIPHSKKVLAIQMELTLPQTAPPERRTLWLCGLLWFNCTYRSQTQKWNMVFIVLVLLWLVSLNQTQSQVQYKSKVPTRTFVQPYHDLIRSHSSVTRQYGSQNSRWEFDTMRQGTSDENTLASRANGSWRLAVSGRHSGKVIG
ncbi:hypothetical protein Bca4012_065452 [Brassica carinata]|uniref:Uncharacterized protein n=1 Tax=Brassica carinata TaxID=52824 RepID=A0A8X7VPQ2_BRACI|nr:hypothetical protein Bca52824_017792 [Brassica carinata]